MQAAFWFSPTSGGFRFYSYYALSLLQRPKWLWNTGPISPPWIQVVSVQNIAVTKSINAVLGLGESSAIALALETQNPLIILDDRRARAYAKNLGLDYTGVIGLLRLGYKKGIIKDIGVLLTELKNDCFYLPNNVEELIKK